MKRILYKRFVFVNEYIPERWLSASAVEPFAGIIMVIKKKEGKCGWRNVPYSNLTLKKRKIENLTRSKRAAANCDGPKVERTGRTDPVVSGPGVQLYIIHTYINMYT